MGECNHAGQMIGISDGSSIYAWKCLNCGQQFPRNAFVRGKWRVDSANERLKGGDANADPTGSNPSTKSIPATSPGVTARASEIEELADWLDSSRSSYAWDNAANAAALIRRLVAERDNWKRIAERIANLEPKLGSAESRATAAEAHCRQWAETASRQAERIDALTEEAERLRVALRETATAWMAGDTYQGDPREVYETAMDLSARNSMDGKSDG